MKFSWSWLCDYLDPVVGAEEKLESILLQAGIEIDNVWNINNYKGFEIVQIETIVKHPNSDNLNLCGLKNKTLEVVCGAPNVRAGMYCILANTGAIIPKTGTALTKAIIRGIESKGMLCSADELNLINDGADGLLEVDSDSTLSSVVLPNGSIYTVSITPNRSDLLNLYGIARELAAFGLGTLKSPRIYSENQAPVKFISSNETIEVNSEDVLSMYSINLTNIQNNHSPIWLRQKLADVSINTHSAIVDVTNYIAHALGQPLHAFDHDYIQKINIEPIEHSTFKDLKSNVHEINDLTCMTSEGRILSVPGIIGGDFGKCLTHSKKIILESGNYARSHIYKAQQMICRTEASRKFFYGIDPEMTVIALVEATYMIAEICQSNFDSAFAAKNFLPQHPEGLSLPTKNVQDLGIDLDFANNALVKLGFSYVDQKYLAPSWRNDIKSSDDLLEEVMRMYDYNNIPEVPFKLMPARERNNNKDLYDILRFAGLSEVVNKDFISKTAFDLFRQDSDFIISNPMSSGEYAVRNSLLPGLIETYSSYLRYNWQCKGIFEIADVFIMHSQSIVQEKRIGIALKKYATDSWFNKSGAFEYFSAKNLIERCVAHLVGDLGKLRQESPQDHSTLINVCKWYYQDILVAEFGELNQSTCKANKVKTSFYLAEIRLPFLDIKANFNYKINQSEHEVICKDISCVVPPNTTCLELMTCLQNFVGPQIEIQIFDLYPDAVLSNPNRSVGIRLIWPYLHNTLTTDEISEILAGAERILIQIGCTIKDK